MARADEAYAARAVEARRARVASARINAISFAFAASPEEAMRGCARTLAEIWTGIETGIETARLALPPARLALDPGDVVTFAHDGRHLDFRIVSAADDRHRGLEPVRVERDLYDLAPGAPRAASLPGANTPVAPLFGLMDPNKLKAASMASMKVIPLPNREQLSPVAPTLPAAPLSAMHLHRLPGSKAMFSREDFSRMAAQLADIEGRFIMSLNDVDEVRKTFRNFRFKTLETSYTIGKQQGEPAKRGELLVSSFKLPLDVP